MQSRSRWARYSAGHSGCRALCLAALGCGLIAAGFAQGSPIGPSNDQPGRVEGEVRNAIDGTPIERAHVRLDSIANGGQERYGALTNAEGRFAISNLPLGSYNLMLDRVGFVDMNFPGATMLILRAGEKKDPMKLKLTPAGTITGRVLDSDGKPVESIQVMAESAGSGRRGAVTDDRGMYRIGGLHPGKYRVRALPQELPAPPEIRTDNTVEVHYSATYHPGALDAKSATRVLVGAATDVPGIDIHMVRTAILHVGGKVAGMPPGAQNVSVVLRSQSGGGNGALVRPDGSFEVWRPVPGKYTVQANYYNSGAQLSSAPVEIEIRDSDVENITLQLMAPEDIHGQVDFLDEEVRNAPQPNQRPAQPAGQSAPPGAPATTPTVTPQRPPQQRIYLRGADFSQGAAPAEIADDGAFTLLKVPPGKYRLSIFGSTGYVQSTQLGPTAMEGATLDLRNGSGGAPLRVRVAAATGVVQGTVRDEKGPVAGARVVLDEETADRVNPNFAITKEDGTYAFTGVAPGKYKIFTVDDPDLGAVSQGAIEDYDDIARSIDVAAHQTVNQDLRRKPN
ncbi:MAG TPA: carboxypeptidase regulatory-like domain-containing protein [Candidatus Acidoferrales bacterium]|jgi:hypothetical protein|nr:carboxypeptidase regulatory-like domain-containing protein [Candidatus Acidoferrales bacterium]